MHTDTTGPLSSRFAPPQETATAAMICLGAGVLMDLASIADKANQLRVINGLESGTARETDAVLADAISGVVGLVALPVYLATVLCFLLWFYRGVRYARQFDPNPRGPSAGWAVGSFFVPFANLFVPVRAALAAWQVSFMAEQQATGQPRESQSTSLVSGWWGMWILANVVYNFAMRLWLRPRLGGEEPTLGQIEAGIMIELGGDVLNIVAGVLCLSMVWQLTAVQRRVAERAAPGGAFQSATA